jgi:SWI/SNF-related matrix-associated actin-dependent regulator of chromatin subfamily A3
MSELDRRLSIYGGHPYEGHVELDIAAMEEQYCVVFKDGEAMGDLNAQMDKALHSLAQEPISFEVLVNIRSVRETIEKAVNHKEAAVRVNINVYGPRRDARKIGQQLSTHKLYFQKPDDVRQGCVYDNPHVLKLADHQPTMQELPTLLTNQETAPEPNETEAFKKAVTLIFSSLRRGEKLTGLEGDKRLTTTLLQHQKEALDFMSQRENGPIPEEFVLWKPAIDNGHSGYRHAITSAFSRFSHQEVGGGILADDMGMGKTLSVLALVLQTLGAAEHWASGTSQQALELENTHGRSDNRRARTTLIIASSDLMINEWYHEMKEHIHEDTRRSLKRLKYHGQNRETDLDKLRDYDLIVTTYHTLASDLARGRDPLNQIEWYRLVLDEAHIIRRHSTKLYRTVAQLKARSRWCLTGTPIQNRLDDIGSLLTFLRIDPFHSMANFRRFITTPFETGGTYKKLAIDNLVRLLDSVNLRRTKDLLHLPEQRNRVRMLDFSDEERQQYEHTRQMIDRASRSQDNGFDQTTLGLFQMRLQLRILCNHGTFQQPFAWNRRKLHLLDAREAVENAIGEVGNVICSACQQPMPMWDDGSMYKRYTTCRHVLCSDCVDQSTLERQTGLEGSNNNFLSNCPLCTSLWSSMKRTVSSTESDSYFRNEGKSTKMKALMEDVRENISSTKR